MNDAEIKVAIVQSRWRVWYKPKFGAINDWVVQRRNWYGGWKTVGRCFTDTEAQKLKKVLMQEDLLTFRGNLKELK